MTQISRRTIFASAAGALAPSLAWADDNPLVTAMAGTQTPGMAALVIRDFRAEREIVAGVRKLGQPAPVARGDRWHLGSDGKAMTATLIARLVDRGVLAWDTPLAQMLPDLAAQMDPSYRDVTLPDLLSHRSGLPENISDMDFFNTFYDAIDSVSAQRLRYLGRALDEAPATPKRGDMSYSNTGVMTAAACAEHATGKPFEELIVSEVFQSLHMRSVDFAQYGAANEPSGHVDNRIADHPHDANPPMFAPCGGMRMSLPDWSKFCIDHMRGEHGQGELLRPETYRFLHAPQGDTRSALGWGNAPAPMHLKGPALTHSGSDGNWFALVVLFYETGNGVLVTANAADSMGGDAAATAAIHALAQTIAPPAT